VAHKIKIDNLDTLVEKRIEEIRNAPYKGIKKKNNKKHPE
jgi:hypothetical protein